jgi:pimeloyl-ACP methyl ester carboxylesterase
MFYWPGRRGIDIVHGFASASGVLVLLLAVATQQNTLHAQTSTSNSPALPSSFRHETAMVNGVRLHSVIGGKGPVLILIHGLPASWYEWRAILPALAARYTVIAPDLRGLGDSSKPPGGYDTHTAAEDIHQLMRSMGISRVFVAGHDWGAAVGFAYAARYPQEVLRLAILDMTIPGFGAEDGFRVTRQGGPWHTIFHMVPDVPEALIAGRERQYLSIFYSGLYGSGDNPTAINSEEIDEYVRVYTKPGALRAYLSYYRSLFDDADRNREATKTKLSLPVLALGGERTMGATAGGVRLKEAVEQLEVKVVPRAAHWVIHDAPDFVAQQLLSFFGPTK